MKMFYGNTPIKSLNIKHYEMDTNSATVQPSDLQSGVTCFAKGRKVTGTGKAFTFASYGDFPSNKMIPIPVSEINTIIVSAVDYNVKMMRSMKDIRALDFSSSQEIAIVSIEGIDYPIAVNVANNMITINCEQTITLQLLFGKDDYI